MKIIYKSFIILATVFCLSSSSALSNDSHFIDFEKVLNTSIAGKDAQNFLKKNLKLKLRNIKTKKKILEAKNKKLYHKKN